MEVNKKTDIFAMKAKLFFYVSFLQRFGVVLAMWKFSAAGGVCRRLHYFSVLCCHFLLNIGNIFVKL